MADEKTSAQPPGPSETPPSPKPAKAAGAKGKPAKPKKAAPAEGGAQLVDLLVRAPKGFVMHRVVVRVVRDAWTRTLYEDLVAPGDHVRVVGAVLPGDRVIATLDGVDVFVKRY